VLFSEYNNQFKTVKQDNITALNVMIKRFLRLRAYTLFKVKINAIKKYIKLLTLNL